MTPVYAVKSFLKVDKGQWLLKFGTLFSDVP